jgi:hypothetical protein
MCPQANTLFKQAKYALAAEAYTGAPARPVDLRAHTPAPPLLVRYIYPWIATVFQG